ncbi:alpha/beta hydrolase [Alkalilacustris brevis]|uniref:alpha/beta hydrolase n=1 Tax=Alkalilacustris brevis TaxID=2026338 RepID=UPI000E0D4537|nr:alpha/beta hydrolase [Alkalilacustris brevis]
MDMDTAYANAPFIAGAEHFPPRWKADAAAFRAALGARARLDLPYGPGPRQKLDLFLPETRPEGLVLFIHGGFWRAFGREDWSHLAAGPVAQGWAVAMPSYTLAPQARISEITSEMVVALEALAGEWPGLPIVGTGHSAGGHLCARLACQGVLTEPLAARLHRVVPISPLADLRPLMQTAMNDDLRLDAAEAEAESPVNCRPLGHVAAHVWVGGDERPAFLDQARWLGAAWGVPVTVAQARHHFDVIDALAQPGSALVDLLIGSVDF